MNYTQAVKSMTFNGIVIKSRAEDNYINATQMCKAGGKQFKHWYSLKATEKLVSTLERDVEISASQLVDVKKGNTSLYAQGSWIHPDLAVQLAQWISPSFALQVSRWIRELFARGTVSISSVRTDEEVRQLELKCFQLEKERELFEVERKQKEVELVKARRKELKLEEFIRSTEKLPKTEVIYMASSTAYQNQNRYKIGGCSSEAKLESRLNSYNTGHAKNDPYYFTEYWLVHSYSEVEKIIKTKLTHYKDNRDRNDEMYHIHGAALMRALTFSIFREKWKTSHSSGSTKTLKSSRARR